MAQAAEAESYQHTFAPLHSIFHELRNKVFDLQNRPPNPDERYDPAFCSHVLGLTKTIFQHTTGAKCSCCLKVFDEEQERVYTLERDSKSRATRGAIDHGRTSSLSRNTDFDEIVRGRRTYFLCNNLVSLADSGLYLYNNDREDWQEHYRSALVLRIRCYDERLDKHQLFGFLCLDSLETDVFDESLSVQIGACVADMI